MIDDSLIRAELLKRFPELESFRFEMEEFDYGDVVGATYWTGSQRLRAQAQAVRRTEAEVTDELARKIRVDWLGLNGEPVADPIPAKRPRGRPRKVR